MYSPIYREVPSTDLQEENEQKQARLLLDHLDRHKKRFEKAMQDYYTKGEEKDRNNTQRSGKKTSQSA
jgi:hypothetical protein